MDLGKVLLKKEWRDSSGNQCKWKFEISFDGLEVWWTYVGSYNSATGTRKRGHARFKFNLFFKFLKEFLKSGQASIQDRGACGFKKKKNGDIEISMKAARFWGGVETKDVVCGADFKEMIEQLGIKKVRSSSLL